MSYTLMLAAASDTNRNFGIVLGILVLALITLIVIAVRHGKKEEERRSRPPVAAGGTTGVTSTVSTVKKPERREKVEEAPVLMGALAKKSAAADAKKAGTADLGDVRRDESIDKSYAEHHGQWVCPYCETLNSDELGLCQACGSPRN